MRNSVIGCIVLFAMAGTACNKEPKPSEPSEVSWPEGVPREIAVDLGGGMKMELVLIPSGEFMMGSGESAEETAAFFKKNYGMHFETAELAEEFNRLQDEHPQHRVRITKPFYLGTYNVTRGQFRQFVKDTGYKTDAEKHGAGLGMGPRAEGLLPQRKVLLAEHGIRADRRAPGGQRKLERRGGVLPVAQPEGGQDLSVADRGRVGIRLSGRNDNAILQRRRSRDVGQGGERGRRDGRGGSSRTGNTRSRPMTATCSQHRRANSSPTPSGSTTCTAMPRNGARIGMAAGITTANRPQTTRPAQLPELAVSFEAVPGTIGRSTPVPPFAAMAIPTAPASTRVSALLGLQ